MSLRSSLALYVLAVAACSPEASGPAAPGRIIDVHLHTVPAEWTAETAPVNPVTGQRSAATTGADLLPQTIRQMDKHSVEIAILSGPLESVQAWVRAAPGRFIGAPQLPMTHTGTTLELVRYMPSEEVIRDAVEQGDVGAMGEITAQYAGMLPSDPALDPYLSMAAELDLPVGIHTGHGTIQIIGSEAQQHYRVSHGNPNWVNDILARYPSLRVYLMHAGYPYLDDTIALMGVYPQVYADLSRLNWSYPRASFHDYLSRLIDAGLGDRLMFGSDGVGFPEAIGLAVAGIESADFLTQQQKADIFYNNAARFFRLDPASADGGA